MFTVRIRTSRISEDEINRFMMFNEGNPQEIIGQLRHDNRELKKKLETKNEQKRSIC